MLQLKKVERGLEVKNGPQTLILDEPSIVLADTTIDRAGEYEAGGIEVIYGQTAALIAWDKLQIVFVFSLEKTIPFEKAQFSPCDVVVFGSSLPKLTKAIFNELLELFDPKVVVIDAKTDISEVQSIVKVEPIESGKLASQSLPEEGREFIVLL